LYLALFLDFRCTIFAPTVVLALALLDQPAAAQEPEKPPDPQEQKAETKEPPTPPHTGLRAVAQNLVEDAKKLPAKQNLYLDLAAIGGGLAVALSRHRASTTIGTISAMWCLGRPWVRSAAEPSCTMPRIIGRSRR
jgi:hypothetical protein